MKSNRPFILLLFSLIFLVQQTIAQQDSVSQKLQNLIETLIAQDNFNGAILYAKGTDILYERYHGVMHPFEEEKITENASFNLASVSKQFFGMALLLLYEEGKIDLDAPVKNYLSDFPHSGIRVRHLVTHIAGLKEYFAATTKAFSTNHIVENEDDYQLMSGNALAAL